MKFIKIIITIIIIFALAFVFYLNLGKFLDATVEPTKTDLLVCLGGGDYKKRIEKTLDLYDKGLLNFETIVLTGYVNSKREVKNGVVEDKRTSYIKNHVYNDIKIVINKDLRNTAEEVLYIKRYMIVNELKSVIIISEAPHSRRILLFFKLLSVNGDDDISVSVVGSDYKDWSSDNYFENKYAKNYAFTEVMKIVYGVFVYGILDKLGLLEWFEKEFYEEIQDSRENLGKGMNFISS